MSAPTLDQLRTFFEENALAQRAAASLKNGAQIALVVDGARYTFTKESGHNRLLDEPATKADMTFTIPGAAALELITRRFDSVGQVGLHIFEDVMSQDPQRKVEARFHCGFLTLMTSGYLGILSAGGADVAKFLGSKGFGSVSKLKDVIARLKS
jgi:hypothetical protein